MFDAFCLGLALTVGQGAPITPMPIPSSDAGRAVVGDELPRRIPAALPSVTVPSAPMAIPGRVPAVPVAQNKDAGTPSPATPAEPKAEEKKNGDEEKKEEEKKEPEKGYFMSMVQGTPFGCWLEENRISVSGWIQSSYTHSTADVSNLPVTWNDRADKFLMQQTWLRIAKSLDTESKCPSYGFQVDFLFGTDYRYTLPRGFWNGQLMNAQGNQNLYGFDIPQIYVNAYYPDIFEGTEIRIGRHFCPFGYESIEGPTSPLLSRSYAFNWCPPFTHWGVMALTNVTKNFSTNLMVVNGNDVMIGDPSEEWRFMGKFAWTSDDKKTSLSFGTSLGRGKFDTGDPFTPTTIGLAFEPAGRNNINVFDLVYSTALSDELSYALEMIYGYQYGVPANVVGGMIDFQKAPGQTGTAHWGSIVNYLTYTFSEQVSGIVRFEMFDDFEGQRTGFEGVYYSTTLGLQFKPSNCVMFRPEIRWDCNRESRPFEGKHQIFLAAADLIFKF